METGNEMCFLKHDASLQEIEVLKEYFLENFITDEIIHHFNRFRINNDIDFITLNSINGSYNVISLLMGQIYRSFLKWNIGEIILKFQILENINN